MKLSGLLLLGLLSSGCVLANPSETRFTVRVLDVETGTPVTNAMVQSFFTQKRDPWGTGVGKENRVKVMANEKGEAIVSGRTIQKGEGATAFADGYYADSKGFKFTGKNLALNRWEPWDPAIVIKMRPKKNPVSMVFREYHKSAFKVPAYDQPVGYDLEKQSFVAPHGNGSRSDLFLEFHRSFENSQKNPKVATNGRIWLQPTTTNPR